MNDYKIYNSMNKIGSLSKIIDLEKLWNET
jgi:hypothetical protein